MDDMNDLPVLCRPRANAVAAGVCAGVAQRLRIDPIIVRVLVVALAFAGGFGIALYLAGIATIPREGKTTATAQRLLPFLQTWPPVASTLAVAAAIMVGFGIAGGWRGGDSILPLVGLVIVIYAVTRYRSNKPTPVSPPEPTPFERAADAWQQRMDAQRGLASGLVPVPTPMATSVTTPYAVTPIADVPQVPVPVAPPRKGHGWAIALGLSAVSVGMLLVINATGITFYAGFGAGIPPAAFAAAILMSFGIALLASVKTKRPRGMVFMTILTAIVTAGMFFSPGAFTHPHSGPDAEPGTAAFLEPINVPPAVPEHIYTDGSAIPGMIDLGVGSQTIDFSGVSLALDVSTSISLTAGELYVVVPTNLNVEVTWSVQAGEATLDLEPYGRYRTDGWGLGGTDTSSTDDYSDGPTLHISAKVGAGNLTVVER